ncbi:MAG TPA: DUF2939 domain-containing protein [Xanthobacteraceae bacterium]|nr:DUF2939 domain-containing protein [Xanthobacteraceae bacterium]
MRWFLATLAAIVLILFTYFGSAYVALSDLVTAARTGDAERIVARTDSVRLKQSVADQIVWAYLEQVGKTRKISTSERFLANTVGTTLADALISQALTTEGLLLILREGKLLNPSQNIALTELPRLADLNLKNIQGLAGRIRMIKLREIAIRIGSNIDRDNNGAVRMRLDGFGWKLSGVDLPPRTLRELAARLPVR